MLLIGLFSITCLAQKAITFDQPNGKLFFTEQIDGQNLTKSYPIMNCYYTYEAALNRISIYFGGISRTTIYSGAFANVSVSGKLRTAEKLQELNTKLISQESVVSKNENSESLVPTAGSIYSLTTLTGHMGEFSRTYTIPATATFWSICNVGEAYAIVTDNTSNETLPLRPGQCISDEIKYRTDSNSAIRVSSITVNATGTICTYQWK